MTTSPTDPLDQSGTAYQPVAEPAPLAPSGHPSGQFESSSSWSTPSATNTAKDEAQNVRDAAAGATSQVADTAKQQADKVASDVREQARKLVDETRSQLSSQALDQRDKAVSGLRSLGDELRDMSDLSFASGLGTQLAKESADLTHKVADFIGQREPAQLLDEVRSYARRKPATFLIGAAVAGVVAGRLTRGAVAANRRDDSAQESGSFGGYAQATPSTYLGAPVGSAAGGPAYTDPAAGYGSPQLDQLGYPTQAPGYQPEPTYVGESQAYAANTDPYAPEEPGPYDVSADQPTTAYPPEQGYRP